MITWNDFAWFAWPAMSLWIAGSAISLRGRKPRAATIACIGGLCIYAAFIIAFWAGLQRPPLRTLGETRLWYSFFMMLAGTAIYMRWRYRWILPLSTVITIVFTLMNILKPEIHDQSLMPALQSAWFVPHVTVYILSYSILGCAFIVSAAGLIQRTDDYLPMTDQIVYVGMAFLTFGLLSGALWAKEAWGNYWSWDPKETWAAATWSLYLIYIHQRLRKDSNPGLSYTLLIVAFICLQMCWYGVNYLPSAQDSMHVYGNA